MRERILQYLNLTNFVIAACVLSLCSKLYIMSVFRIGDLLLLFALVLLAGKTIIINPIKQNALSEIILLLIISCLISIFLGTPVTHFLDVLILPNMLHDTLSILLTLLLAFFFLLNYKTINITNIYFIAGIYIIIEIIVFCFMFSGLITRLNWLDSPRLSFFSANPNQFALLMLPAPFLFIFLMDEIKNIFCRGVLGIFFLLTIYIGYLIKSDALYFAWIVGFYPWIKKGLFNRFSMFFLFLAVLVAFTLYSDVIIQQIDVLLKLINKYIVFIGVNKGQGSDRIQRWINAIIAVSYSPLWGLGPGTYSGAKAPFLQGEAHNTLLDIAMYGGILSLILFIYFFVIIVRKLFRDGHASLLMMSVSLLVFSMFHYTLRQPFFIFMFLFAYLLSRTEKIQESPN